MQDVNLQQTQFQLSSTHKDGSNLGKVFVYICLIVWSATTILPLLWVFNNSFKSSADVVDHSFAIAFTLESTLQNYYRAFEVVNILKSYMNSLIMSGSTVFFVLLFGGMAAYIISRFKFRLRGILYGMLVFSLLIPAFATVVPVYQLLINFNLGFVKLNLINTYASLIIVHTAGFLPFCTLVIAGYMATIPKELEEAAWIDGCSRQKMYINVFLPLSAPAFATCSIFVFLWSYNDLFSSLIFVQQHAVRPIVVILSFISSQYGTDFGLMASAVMITVIPILIVYLLAQRHIQQGLTEGAIK